MPAGTRQSARIFSIRTTRYLRSLARSSHCLSPPCFGARRRQRGRRACGDTSYRAVERPLRPRLGSGRDPGGGLIDHSAARYGDRPQSVLNEQLVDTADIVIAIFWNRLGSPTGEAESGTLEEIERAHDRGAYVGILRCERPARQEQIDLDQLSRLREYFETIKGEALYLGYEDDAGLSRHVEAILNQAVARGGAQLDDQPVPTAAATVWPRVDRERYQETDSKGRLKTKTRWRFVLVNEGAEPARDVSFHLEPYGGHSEGAQAPMVLDSEAPIEVLAPNREIGYHASLYSGTSTQARCTIRWTDSEGEHEQSSIVGFS